MTKTTVPPLIEMLRIRRSHNSPGEKVFIKKYIMPLKPTIIVTDVGDNEREPMAFMVEVGNSNIMFTSHVDTVHMKTDEVYQNVLLKDGKYQKNDNQPLGADDAAGVWLMLHMINAEIPGVYMFFRGEERGGIGSKYCASKRKDLFDGIQCAIAFDRRGTTSIITHQGGERGCSEEFSASLSKVLGMGHVSDATGLYTDTKEFFHLVPNCTNVSVGYNNEHSKNETLIKTYIEKLRDNLLRADWSLLDFTAPKPEPMTLGSFAPKQLFKGATESGVSDIFEPNIEVGPLDVADFLFDSCEQLPRDLMERALSLAQDIYKRFE